MTKRRSSSGGYANRTPWDEATREVPAAWLEDEARHSSSPYSLLASWKGNRGGVPSHVMIKLLRRRLQEYPPDMTTITPQPARLQRAQDMLKEIWARSGAASEKHPVWRLVEGMLRLALDRVEVPHGPPGEPDQAGSEPGP
ncbi:MAG TPA: hypothetical protein VJX92_00165 [Methylomirabilota bacterium]|nr:hypothetical protein [Methylomirabilota bacterium]